MYHKKIDSFINDLRKLQSVNNISMSGASTLKFQIPEFKLYLTTVFGGGKPEEALATHLFKVLMHDDNYCYLRADPQMKAGNGWVDFLIHGASGNPVAFELKPMHRLIISKILEPTIEQCSIERDYDSLAKGIEIKGDNQIQEYLKTHEYVLLTNMIDIYYFNRESRFNFKPFRKDKFIDFINALRETQFDIWDLIRRKEDEIPKHDLDKSFFVDLKKWYKEFSNVQFQSDIDSDEKIVQILNKFIFLRTLEDYSLIPYNHIIDSYDISLNKWKAKGYKRVFKEFFSDLNKWAYLYYDTELFKDDTFALIEQSDANLANLQEAVERILGLSAWSRTFGMGLIHYNYRAIDEDIFGKTYEIFLAEQREERGIHYTPSVITESMGLSLINELFLPHADELLKSIEEQNFDDAEKIVKKILAIKIIDPSCGSGSFLVKLLRHIWNIYQNLKKETEWAVQKTELLEPQDIADRKQKIRKIRQMLTLDSNRKLIPLIILRHLHGIDLDEKALDVAKVNIWKEAIKLCPNDYRYTSLSSNIDHILPNLELNFIHANSLVDFYDMECVKHLEPYKEDIKQLHKLRNTYIDNPFDPTPIDKCKAIIEKLRVVLFDAFKSTYGEFEPLPLFAPLNFFYCFFDNNGKPLYNTVAGFDGVIGNPPYNIFTETAYFKQSVAAGTGNLFGHFIVKGVYLNKAEGAFSFIVPLSFTCGSDYEKVRQLVYKNYGHLKTSHYSIRPAKLFPGVDQRMTIFIATKKGSSPCIVESSRLYRFTNDERDQIVKNPVTGEVGPVSKGFIPRIADSVGASIYKKLNMIDKTIGCYQVKNGIKKTNIDDNFAWWYHSVARYWIKAYNFLPYFTRNEVAGISSKINKFYAFTEDIAKVCVGLVNSNLFYFWWIIQSDEFDVLPSEILSMPMPESLLKDAKIPVLVDNLMTDYKEKALRKTLNINGVKIQMDEIHPRKSTKIIFELDRAIAPHYGLTEKEIMFLQEYDKRFRLSDEEDITIKNE